MNTNGSLYVQVKFSRTDGRSFDTGMTGFGEDALAEAREMARNLTRSAATTHVEVMTEIRDGAMTEDPKVYRWTPAKGWY